MKLPLSLIKSFVKFDLPPTEVGEILTLLGIEVDAIEHALPSFAGVVIGEVLGVKKHPEANNLQIAEVSDGKKTYTVVCGAPNCRAGMKTAFAKIGAHLTDADGRQRRIEKCTIRGIESLGMLCSGSELGINHDHDGILDLPHEMTTGEDASILWDPVFELSLTPNLGHCMSALGVARELSAALQIPLSCPKPETLNGKKIEVTISDLSLCPRYMCCLIEGVKIGPSPFWLKKQLEASGQKSINNVVDATNYIMLKFGQPLHAFDADLVEGEKILVCPAKEPFSFLGLDGVEREVPKGALLINDANKPIALAGVMGADNSAVTEKTTRILLEAACFDPIQVRNTSKKVGLRTESSQRFEKGVDPIGVELALSEAAKLIGKVSGSADMKQPLKTREIGYRVPRINQILGTKLSETEVEELLERLMIHAKNGKARIPSFRTDLNEEIDLAEEVARIYGYNNIEKTIPSCSNSTLPNDPVFLFESEMRNRFAGAGLSEFLTCDLISPSLAEIAHEITPESMGFLKTAYSKSEDYSVLRTSLLPGLLQVVKGNFAQKNHTIAAFEIGRIHFLQKETAIEIPMAGILLTGHRNPPNWSQKPIDVDFYDLKGIIENLLQGAFVSSNHMSFHPGRQADVQIEDLIVGSLGEVHPRLLEKFDIERPVYYAELNLLHLLKKKKTHLKMIPLPQFPSSERDWTIPLSIKTPIGDVFDAIQTQKPSLLEKVELIDLYTPEGQNVKNATFRFVYRDLLETVSFEEVEREHAKLIEAAKQLAK